MLNYKAFLHSDLNSCNLKYKLSVLKSKSKSRINQEFRNNTQQNDIQSCSIPIIKKNICDYYSFIKKHNHDDKNEYLKTRIDNKDKIDTLESGSGSESESYESEKVKKQNNKEIIKLTIKKVMKKNDKYSSIIKKMKKKKKEFIHEVNMTNNPNKEINISNGERNTNIKTNNKMVLNNNEFGVIKDFNKNLNVNETNKIRKNYKDFINKDSKSLEKSINRANYSDINQNKILNSEEFTVNSGILIKHAKILSSKLKNNSKSKNESKMRKNLTLEKRNFEIDVSPVAKRISSTNFINYFKNSSSDVLLTKKSSVKSMKDNIMKKEDLNEIIDVNVLEKLSDNIISKLVEVKKKRILPVHTSLVNIKYDFNKTDKMNSLPIIENKKSCFTYSQTLSEKLKKELGSKINVKFNSYNFKNEVIKRINTKVEDKDFDKYTTNFLIKNKYLGKKVEEARFNKKDIFNKIGKDLFNAFYKEN